MKKLVVILLCVAMFLSLGVIGFTASAAETVIYVKDGGTGDGTSEANAYGDFRVAFEAAANLSGDAKLVVVGTVSVPFTQYFISPLYDHLITVVGKDDSSTLHFINGANQVFHFGGDTVIDNITITAENPTTTIIFCANLRNITFGPGFKSEAVMSLRGTYKHSELPGDYGYNSDKTNAVATYTLTVMGGSNWNDIAGYAQNSASCNLTGTVTINVGGGARMNTICVCRNARVTATNAVINIHDAVINRFVGATDRDPVAHLGYNDILKTVDYDSGVSESLIINIYSDYNVSDSFTNRSNDNILIPGISGTSIYILANCAPQKGLTDVESLGSHTLNIDPAVYDAVIDHVQEVSFDTVNKVNLSNTTTPDTTAAPVVTDAPVTTEAPVVTDAPVTTAATVTTAAPDTTSAGSTASPSTGDVTVVFAIAAMAVVACGAVIVLRRRKVN